MFRGRAVVPPAPPVAPGGDWRRQRASGGGIRRLQFDVYRSIWGRRAATCDARDIYDTEEAEVRRFLLDWHECLKMGIDKLILLRDDDGEKDEDGDGVPDEVDQVAAVLWEQHELVYHIFADYSVAPRNTTRTNP